MGSIRSMMLPLWFAAAICVSQHVHCEEIFIYREMCDASAAVALGPDHFVVANDERNKLRIYRRGQADSVGALELSKFLGTKEDKESDLEGAAAIGKRIYWISSHGRNSKGEVQERRFRFFATEVQLAPTPTVRPIGQPYTHLLSDLVTARELKPHRLGDAAKLAPEDAGGLNIEGLAATPGGELLIGFRNPIPGGLALIVPLKNPEGVVNGKKAKFGSPIQLDLGGRGIRSIDLVGSGYLVVAGPHGNGGTFALYRWSGNAGQAATAVDGIDFKGLRPEALFAVPQTNMIQVLSDDGDVETDGVACKNQEESRQSFRSIAVMP